MLGDNLQKILLVALILLVANAYSNNLEYKRGEKLFINYCGGCHSLTYTSYPPVSMPKNEAINWFGIQPPDLTLVTKYRGKQWVTKYLKSFYYDSKRPFKCNNKLMHNVQMPNVLYPIENKKSYSQTVEEIVNFLSVVADPHREKRYIFGIFVEIFLGVVILGLFLIKKFI